MSKFATYEQAGVSIDAADEMEDEIYSSIAGTFGTRVLSVTKQLISVR